MKLILMSLIFFAVACVPEAGSSTSAPSKSRFQIYHIEDNIYLITDSETNREFLANLYHGGFVEIQLPR